MIRARKGAVAERKRGGNVVDEKRVDRHGSGIGYLHDSPEGKG